MNNRIYPSYDYDSGENAYSSLGGQRREKTPEEIDTINRLGGAPIRLTEAERQAMKERERQADRVQDEINRRGAAAVRAMGPLPKTDRDFALLRAKEDKRKRGY